MISATAAAIQLLALLVAAANATPAHDAAPVQAPKPAQSASFEEKQVPFSDDAPKDASLFAFRNYLLKSVQAKDVKALLDALDPTIRSGFDGAEGIDAFKAKWKLNDNPGASPIWQELSEVLRLGGKLDKGKTESHFSAPYVYTALPDAYDATQYGIVVGEGVNVRSKPDETAPAVQNIGRIVVRLYAEEHPKVSTIGNQTFPWRKIGLPGGAVGYVWGKYVRSPLDYRAGFSNQSGQWKMTYFLAGD